MCFILLNDYGVKRFFKCMNKSYQKRIFGYDNLQRQPGVSSCAGQQHIPQKTASTSDSST